MSKVILPPLDKNGIIKALPRELSEQNIQRLNKFGAFMFLYDFAQDHFVRPRLHKQPAVSMSAQRGERIASENGYSLMDE